MLLILMMACNGCGSPEPPSSSAPSVQAPELPLETPAPPPKVKSPPIPLPWPERLPCAEFLSVSVAGAELADAQGVPLAATGPSQQRAVDPALFSPAQITGVYPAQERVILRASCADPRERITWICLKGRCLPEFSRIRRLPTLPYLSLQSVSPDPKELSKMSPDSLPMTRLQDLAEEAMRASLTLLQDCQELGCQSGSTLDRMQALQGTVQAPSVLTPSPWKVDISMGQGRALLTCNAQTCITQFWDDQGWILRFEQRADSASMYLPEGSRLDYRQERGGPRVVFSGLLFPERDAQ